MNSGTVRIKKERISGAASDFKYKNEVNGFKVKDEPSTPVKSKSESAPSNTKKEVNHDTKPSTSNLKRKRQDNSEASPSKKQKQFPTNNDVASQSVCSSDVIQLVADESKISYRVAQQVIQLFDDEATIPFIARYRKNLTGNRTPEELRHIKEVYEEIKSLRLKAEQVENKLRTQKKLTDELQAAINNAKSLNELDFIYEPYKQTRRTKVDIAREAGLELYAKEILNGWMEITLESLIDSKVKAKATLSDVQLGIILLMTDIMSKDIDILNYVRELQSTERIMFKCEKVKEPSTQKIKIKKEKSPKKSKQVNENTFSCYFSFYNNYKAIKPYQYLAINRGCSLKVLQSTVEVPDSFRHKLFKTAQNKWLTKGYTYPLRTRLFQLAYDEMYKKKIVSYVQKNIRSELKKSAELASIDAFALNLKHLLLTPPVRGLTILAIDPGFKQGCKVAVVHRSGQVLDTTIIRMEEEKSNRGKISSMVQTHKVSLIAIGNGTGCRPVERFISSLIQQGAFKPLDVSYMIVSEQGVSIYSCSKDATAEYPGMDPLFISAVSLAKRVQDPLCELIKVEPKHLGVGMYQHDLDEKKLVSSLDEVVSLCVSEVGVDINTASVLLLKKIAGLSEKKAKAIINVRDKQGPFTKREKLKDIKGIGPKTFQQCAGFIRVIPTTTGSSPSPKTFNPLDQTDIHPESYKAANDLVKMSGLNIHELGEPGFIRKFESFMSKIDASTLSDKLQIPIESLNIMTNTFTQPLGKDIRSQFSKPIFKKEITSLNNLKVGQILTGRIENVTDFGAFVDVGVEKSGLIPRSHLREDVVLGTLVEVKIITLNLNDNKFALTLLRVI